MLIMYYLFEKIEKHIYSWYFKSIMRAKTNWKDHFTLQFVIIAESSTLFDLFVKKIIAFFKLGCSGMPSMNKKYNREFHTNNPS